MRKLNDITVYDEQKKFVGRFIKTPKTDWIQVVGVVEETDEEEEFIARDGMLFCGACGILAQPGNEDFDWCDHRNGYGCPYMSEADFEIEDDLDY